MDFGNIVNIVIALFMAVLAFVVQRLVRDLDQNTVETHKLTTTIGELSTSIARHYVQKTDFDTLDNRYRTDIAAMESRHRADISTLENRHRTEHEKLTDKFDVVNRQVGALSAQVEHGVAKLKYPGS